MDSYKALMIGEKAPAFRANTTYGMINFPEDYKGKWVVFFSHPGDFTPVCTTEIMTFASMQDDFKKNNCELLGLSVDQNPSHIQWCRAMEKYQWKNIKNPKIAFPIVADDMGMVSKMYGMLMPASSTTKTVRTVFFIDPNGTIRAMLSYPLTTGRNMKEIMRLLLALQEYDKNETPTPADWQPGDSAIMSPPSTMTSAGERAACKDRGDCNCVDWYLCFADAAMKNNSLSMGGQMKMVKEVQTVDKKPEPPKAPTETVAAVEAPVVVAAPSQTQNQVRTPVEIPNMKMTSTDYKSRYTTRNNTPRTSSKQGNSKTRAQNSTSGSIMEQNQMLFNSNYFTDQPIGQKTDMNKDYMLTRDYPNMGE